MSPAMYLDKMVRPILISPSPQDLVTQIVAHLNNSSRTAYDLFRKIFGGGGGGGGVILKTVNAHGKEQSYREVKERNASLGLVDEDLAIYRLQQCYAWFLSHTQLPDNDIERSHHSCKGWHRRL